MTQAVTFEYNTRKNMDTESRIACVDGSHAQHASELPADLRQAVQDGIDSGPAIPADQVFAELNARYAGHPA